MPAQTAKLDVLAPNSLVLVTGANGYIASHVVDQLLQLGHRVRGTVRAEKPWLQEFFDARYETGKLELVVVPDLSVETDVVNVIQGVDGVIHLAADTSFGGDPHAIITPTVKNVKLLLKSAAAVPSVRRVVFTSSSVVTGWPKDNVGTDPILETSWNAKDVELAWDPNTPAEELPWAVYGAAKTEGERTAWDWVKEHKPSFVLNTVLPNTTTGKILHPNIGGSTQGMINAMLQGNPFPIHIDHNIDVIDVAKLHVIGLTGSGVENRRIFASAHEINRTLILKLLKELRPDNELLPAAPENDQWGTREVVPAKEAEQLLRTFYGAQGWKPLRDSLREGIETA